MNTFRKLTEFAESYDDCSTDHDIEFGSWTFYDVILKEGFGPFKIGDKVSRVAVLLSPIDGHGSIRFYSSSEDYNENNVTFQKEIILQFNFA